jgi:hypothetical protein
MLTHAFVAARRTLSPAKLFETFSTSLQAKPDKKSKKSASAFGRWEAVRDALKYYADVFSYNWDYRMRRVHVDERSQPLPELDPRWVDVAVSVGDLELVHQLARPNHAATNKFLAEQFTARSKKTGDYECQQVLATMVRIGHPGATEGVVQWLKQIAKSPHHGYAGYWLGRLISDLPKDAAPTIEALIPTLPEKMVDSLMDSLLALKNKSTAS